MDTFLYFVLIACLACYLKNPIINAYNIRYNYDEPKRYHEESLISEIQKFARNLRLEQEVYRQEIMRLKSSCSNKYVSIRENRMRADVSFNDAFDDNFTLIEITYSYQMNPKLVALKSVLRKQYICFDFNRGLFKSTELKFINENCIFILNQTPSGRIRFTLGSSSNFALSFDRHGRMISYYTRRYRALSCSNETFVKIKGRSDNQNYVKRKRSRKRSRKTPNNYETLIYYYSKPKMNV